MCAIGDCTGRHHHYLKRTPMLSMTSNFGMILKNAWRWINWRQIWKKSAVFCSMWKNNLVQSSLQWSRKSVLGKTYFYIFTSKKIYISAEVQSSMEEMYRDFCDCHRQTPERSHFTEFFQFLQVKSYSEAICESLRSMVNMATGIGRVLYPENYTEEIYLHFIYWKKRSFLIWSRKSWTKNSLSIVLTDCRGS